MQMSFQSGGSTGWRDERLIFGEAMELLGVSKATLHRWVEQGRLTPLEDMGGKQRWFARIEVEQLVRREC
jgi:excisionase family DNA binding protein